MNKNAMFLTDFYKINHHNMYVAGLDKLVSYWTPRMSRIDGIDKVVMFGLQGFIKEYLIDYFNRYFFNRPIKDILHEIKEISEISVIKDDKLLEVISDLHKLGYLPIEIKAIQEGKKVNIKTPMIQITNTDPKFAWLVNYLETLISCYMWQPITSATIGYEYRKIINKYYKETACEDEVPCNMICGDFSMRGMSSIESSITSAAGFLLSFTGTSTIPVIPYLKNNYYLITETDKITTVPATEHSIMCSYGKENEFESYKHLINEIYPDGNISIVSDTYDYWNVLTNYLPELYTDIMKRDGKVIIRGDSGNPCDILCGDPNAKKDSPEYKGTVEILWDIFGGYVNKKGYKVLNSHIGTIYGDGITLERCEEICRRLKEKGFSISNIVLGVGSFSLQYNTRDTFGFAIKATHAVVNGEERFIFKSPKTDKDNFKKSQKGMCVVYEKDGNILYKDELTLEEADKFNDNLLERVFIDGKLTNQHTIYEIRRRVNNDEFNGLLSK